MPSYILHCPPCNIRTERFMHAHERPGAKCECGRDFETHPDQFSSVGIGAGFKRAERMSRTMAFQEAGIPEIKRDCPSMDFKVRDGEAVPVYHDDKHQKKCQKELAAAGKRYRAERDEKVKASRPKVNKHAAVRRWMGK